MSITSQSILALLESHDVQLLPSAFNKLVVEYISTDADKAQQLLDLDAELVAGGIWLGLESRYSSEEWFLWTVHDNCRKSLNAILKGESVIIDTDLSRSTSESGGPDSRTFDDPCKALEFLDQQGVISDKPGHYMTPENYVTNLHSLLKFYETKLSAKDFSKAQQFIGGVLCLAKTHVSINVSDLFYTKLQTQLSGFKFDKLKSVHTLQQQKKFQESVNQQLFKLTKEKPAISLIANVAEPILYVDANSSPKSAAILSQWTLPSSDQTIQFAPSTVRVLRQLEKGKGVGYDFAQWGSDSMKLALREKTVREDVERVTGITGSTIYGFGNYGYYGYKTKATSDTYYALTTFNKKYPAHNPYREEVLGVIEYLQQYKSSLRPSATKVNYLQDLYERFKKEAKAVNNHESGCKCLEALQKVITTTLKEHEKEFVPGLLGGAGAKSVLDKTHKEAGFLIQNFNKLHADISHGKISLAL